MSKAPPLKSLKNCLNDFLNDLGSKNRPFVQPERPSERCPKIGLNLLKLLHYRLNAAVTNARL